MPETATHTVLGACEHSGCTQTYKDHRWGHSEAQSSGWFFQRDGKAWCPVHVPDWVAGWRENKARRSRGEKWIK